MRWPNIPNSGVEFPSFYWILRFHLVVSLLGGAEGQLLDALLCCSQVSRKIPHLHCTVQTARRYKRGFHPEQTHGATFISVYLEDLALGCWKQGVIPGAGDAAHSIGVAGAPGHTAHMPAVHLPHTNWPVLQTNDTSMLFIWPIYRIRVDMWSWNWMTHVPVVIVSLFSGIVSALCLQRCDCVNMPAHLCTACKKRALPENIQWEDGICDRRADKSSGECEGVDTVL